MSQGILILDVTSPGSVEYIGSLDVGDDVVSLAAVGTGLYAGAGDLIVIDVSSPTSPTVVSWAGTTTQSVAVHDSRL